MSFHWVTGNRSGALYDSRPVRLVGFGHVDASPNRLAQETKLSLNLSATVRMVYRRP